MNGAGRGSGYFGYSPRLPSGNYQNSSQHYPPPPNIYPEYVPPPPPRHVQAWYPPGSRNDPVSPPRQEVPYQNFQRNQNHMKGLVESDIYTQRQFQNVNAPAVIRRPQKEQSPQRPPQHEPASVVIRNSQQELSPQRPPPQHEPASAVIRKSQQELSPQRPSYNLGASAVVQGTRQEQLPPRLSSNLNTSTDIPKTEQEQSQVTKSNLPLDVKNGSHDEEDDEEDDEYFDPLSYIDGIKAEYYTTEDCSQVFVSTSLPYAEVTLEGSGSNVHAKKAPFSAEWNLRLYVANSVSLRYVSMLCSERSSLNSFCLRNVKGLVLPETRVAPGDLFKKTHGIYSIGVKFKCSKSGIYKQWICLDLTNQAPYLVAQLHVFVGDERDPAFAVEKFRFDTTVADLDWNSSTVNIVASDWPRLDREPIGRQLLARWKPLGSVIENDSLALRTKSYGPGNYKRVMHSLIRLEEAATSGTIGRVYIDAPVMKIHQTPFGMTIGSIHIGQALDPRTKIGSMTLRNSSRMLLAFKDYDDAESGSENALRKVYEADIIFLDRDSSSHFAGSDLYSTVVRLRLSRRCVDEQNLQSGSSVLLHQARFSIMRLPFCEWHESVERVFCWNILFPEFDRGVKVPALAMNGVKLDPKYVDNGLFKNQGQMLVVKAILSEPEIPDSAPPNLPPIIVQGAFGTGKTYTLAQALKTLMMAALDNTSIRIVLCTMSNSAADLYIKEYIHPFLTKLQREGRTRFPRVLRVYKTQRDPMTVDDVVRQYAVMQASTRNPEQKEFAPANSSYVLSAHLIISNLLGVMDLQRLCLPKDTFSHIFMDEAAQSFEADGLKALSLVGTKTRVVMAGDPRQLAGGTIQCQLLRRYGFDRALIERIGKYYSESNGRAMDLGYGHVLLTNYRCHPSIMEFVQTFFYPDMTDLSNEYQCEFTDYFPFRFINTDSARGFEQFYQPSSSYYNWVEANEIQNQVLLVLKNWKPEFATYDKNGRVQPPQHDFSVIAASDAQVMLMQHQMRQCPETSLVRVSHVHWIQGLEYKAIFISTVRTLEVESPDEAANFDLEFLSDKRLLNTAITRAKNVVVIVGSAKTLTTVGACQYIWRGLINACQSNGTFINAQSVIGERASTFRDNANAMLQSHFQNVSVVPDYVEQRLLVRESKNLRNFESRRGPPVAEQETTDLKRRYPKIVNLLEEYLLQPPSNRPPWKSSDLFSMRLAWMRILGRTEHYEKLRHETNLVNKNEVSAIADLITRIVSVSPNEEILVVCASAAQVGLVKRALPGHSPERITFIDARFPLPRKSVSILIFSLTRTTVKSEGELQVERAHANRESRAKQCLGSEFCDMDILCNLFNLARTGSAIFVGNHFNASVHPVWDWLYRNMAFNGAAFDSIEELGI